MLNLLGQYLRRTAEQGFDFLGYHFGQESLSVAKTITENRINPA